MKKGLKILMSLMKLDIGGAETHVLELAKELKKRGAEVVVTSNGGAYEKELTEFGIKHYKVPLQNKNPLNVIKAFKTLKQIIIDEKIELVHSHARIPSFILGKLHGKMGFPFVTSAHGVFTTKYGLKYITNWGQATVAVSEDIKKYLIDNYHFPEEKIVVTINGIDLEQFSPDTDKEPARKEFGLTEDDFVIVFVSRLDTDCTGAAREIISKMPDLISQIPNLKFLVVGGGSDYENIKALAEPVNKKYGKRIILAGGRTDMARVISPANLFVGVSRAALEAMGAEKPVILAGNQGYIGLFNEENTKISFDTNFCGRGCEYINETNLYSDILKFYNLSEERQKELGEYGRQIVKKHYSVAKMTDDTVKAYDMVLSKQEMKKGKKEILISGYYGFNNSGDDALLQSIIDDLKSMDEEQKIVVMSKKPEQTKKLYNVGAINRINPFSIIRHMMKAKLLISGGGTLIQDVTSTKSLIYYLSIIWIAKFFSLKVMLYANGIGPVMQRKNKRRTRKVLKKADYITLRDEKSKAVLSELGVKIPEIEVTADPVFLMKSADKSVGEKILRKYGVPKDKKIIGISVRDWKKADPKFSEKLCLAVFEICNKLDLYPVFLPLQPKDNKVSEFISQKCGVENTVIKEHLDVSETLSVISNFHMAIGMRLHMLIYAASCAVPIVGISYDPKISGFMEYAKQEKYVYALDLDMEKLVLDTIFISENYDKIKEELIEVAKLMKERAKINGEIVKKLL